MSRISRPNITARDLSGQVEQLKKHYSDTIDRLVFELNDLEKRLLDLEKENNGKE